MGPFFLVFFQGLLRANSQEIPEAEVNPAIIARADSDQEPIHAI
jgi:hypothetical protein